MGGVPQPRVPAKGVRTNARRRQQAQKMKHLGNIQDNKQWVD